MIIIGNKHQGLLNVSSGIKMKRKVTILQNPILPFASATFEARKLDFCADFSASIALNDNTWTHLIC